MSSVHYNNLTGWHKNKKKSIRTKRNQKIRAQLGTCCARMCLRRRDRATVPPSGASTVLQLFSHNKHWEDACMRAQTVAYGDRMTGAVASCQWLAVICAHVRAVGGCILLPRRWNTAQPKLQGLQTLPFLSAWTHFPPPVSGDDGQQQVQEPCPPFR